MYMKGDTITILLLFLAIIGISIWISTSKVLPSFVSGVSAKEGFSSVGYSDAKTHKAIDDAPAQLISSHKKCIQLSGWRGEGAFCGTNSDSEILDIYSQARGDLTCNGYGYHNSKGPLCMDENMKRMLGTRGLNAGN